MGKTWSVYKHVFPNGKVYIGISENPCLRWRNGLGYSNQKKVYRAIQKYGWNNIDHVILFKGLSKERAELEEIKLIKEYDSIRNGYNISIGGGILKSSYLSRHVLSMVNGHKKRIGRKSWLVSMIEADSTDTKAAEFWNEADEVICKYNKYLNSNDSDILNYFYELHVYFACYAAIEFSDYSFLVDLYDKFHEERILSLINDCIKYKEETKT